MRSKTRQTVHSGITKTVVNPTQVSDHQPHPVFSTYTLLERRPWIGGKIVALLTPLAVLTGLALNLGTRAFLCSDGTAAMMSTSLGVVSNEYFDANRVLTRFCEHIGNA